MTEQFFDKLTAWQDATFPKSTAISKLIHLEEEIEELKDGFTIDAKSTGTKHELADCIFLIYGAAKKAGYSYQDIQDCLEGKFNIVLNRDWKEPNEQGVYHHVKR